MIIQSVRARTTSSMLQPGHVPALISSPSAGSSSASRPSTSQRFDVSHGRRKLCSCALNGIADVELVV